MKQKCILFILIILQSFSSYGWGRTGHQIIAEIAVSLLSDKAKDNLERCLGSTSIQEAAVWMDQIKSDRSYDHMKPWHYINIEEGEQYDPSSTNNIVSTLVRVFRELKQGKGMSDEERKVNVMILIHLMGDIQQPLHVGYGSDKGGNKMQVQFNGKGTNLHHVWDDDIIQDQHITTSSVLKAGTSFVKGEMDLLRTKPADFERYMHENRQLLAQVYDFKGHKISAVYVRKSKPAIEQLLLNGGIRLASVLEEVFSR